MKGRWLKLCVYYYWQMYLWTSPFYITIFISAEQGIIIMRVIWWILTFSSWALIHKKSVEVVGGKILIFIINTSYRRVFKWVTVLGSYLSTLLKLFRPIVVISIYWKEILHTSAPLKGRWVINLDNDSLWRGWYASDHRNRNRKKIPLFLWNTRRLSFSKNKAKI